MSSIGSRPDLGSGSQLEVGAARAVAAVSALSTGAGPAAIASGPGSTATSPASVSATTQAAPDPAVVSSVALNPGSAPVDTDRVTQIRKAIETGTYPLIPTKISDAMIAAGLTLRIRK